MVGFTRIDFAKVRNNGENNYSVSPGFVEQTVVERQIFYFLLLCFTSFRQLI